MKHLFTLAVLPCALAAACTAVPAHAEDNDDRFALRLGAMNIDSDNTLRGTTSIGGQELSGSQDFGLGGKEWEPRVDGTFRLSTRQRLIFDYFKYDKDRRETLGDDIGYGDVTVPAGSFVKGELKYQVASLVHDYSVLDHCGSVPKPPRSRPMPMPILATCTQAVSSTRRPMAWRRWSACASPPSRASTG